MRLSVGLITVACFIILSSGAFDLAPRNCPPPRKTKKNEIRTPFVGRRDALAIMGTGVISTAGLFHASPAKAAGDDSEESEQKQEKDKEGGKKEDKKEETKPSAPSPAPSPGDQVESPEDATSASSPGGFDGFLKGWPWPWP